MKKLEKAFKRQLDVCKSILSLIHSFEQVCKQSSCYRRTSTTITQLLLICLFCLLKLNRHFCILLKKDKRNIPASLSNNSYQKFSRHLMDIIIMIGYINSTAVLYCILMNKFTKVLLIEEVALNIFLFLFWLRNHSPYV